MLSHAHHVTITTWLFRQLQNLWTRDQECFAFGAMLANPAAITQQQARLLLPLLQQIASSGTPGPSCESPSGSSGSSFGSSNSSPLFYPTPPRIPVAGTGSGQVGGYSTDESEGAGRYSSDELFQSKKKNSKSSSAHSYCHVSTK